MKIEETKVGKDTEETLENVGLEKLRLFSQNSNKLVENLSRIEHPFRGELDKALTNSINKRTIKLVDDMIDDVINRIETNSDENVRNIIIGSDGEIQTKYHIFKNHLISKGWTSDYVILTERNLYIVTADINNYAVVDIKIPEGCKATIKGMNGIPDTHLMQAHTLSLCLLDDEGNEVDAHSRIRIIKESSSESMVLLDEVHYGEVSLKAGNRYKRFEELYRFKNGVLINGGQHLRIYAERITDTKIKSVEFSMEIDMFSRVD